MRCNRKRRGVSEIIGVLLMVAIVVSLGVLIFTFSSGGMYNLSESYATAMTAKQNAAEEKFQVEQVAFTFPTPALDGTSTNEVTGSSSSIAASLTTASSGDLVMAYVSPADTGATAPPSVSTISGGGLTWSHRLTTPTETYTQDSYVPVTITNNVGVAPALDGKGYTTQGTPTATIAATLTTVNSNDVVIAIVSGQNTATGTYRTPSASDTAALNWHARSTLQEVATSGGYSFFTEIFYAIAASPLSSDSITITWNTAPTHYAVLQVFGVSGANTASPFDAHAGLPDFVNGAYASVTTSNADDFIYGFEVTDVTGSPTAGSGFTGIESGVGGAFASEYKVVAATQTALSMTYSNAASDADGAWGDAIEGAPSAATSSTFQQKVTWDPVTYAAYEASDLGNVRFCADDACNTPLYAWLESCTGTCGTSATLATAWVKLTSAIAGSGGALTVYMCFESTSTEFDGVYWGEAPDLSPSYAQYDNGANVFSLYDNFAGTTLSALWTTVENAGSTVTVNNGVTFTESASASAYAFVVAAPTAYPFVAESYMVSIGSSSADPTLGVTTSTSVNTGIDPYVGYAMDDIPTTLTFASEAAGGATTVSTNAAEGFQAGIWQMTWSATGAERASDGVVTLTGTSATNTIANYGIYVGQSNNVGSTSNVVRWARERAYPPSDDMPTTSLGTTGTASITFDVEEWYAIASSPLSASTITATLSGPDTAATWIAVFGMSGTNTASPFDPNPSVPGYSSTTSPSTTMSTSDSSDVLLYACAAEAGSMASGFTSIYSRTYSPNQEEYVGYQTVSATQSGLATACGANSYGAEISDAAVSSAGADVYVRNVGSIPTTLVSVYITDTTSDTFVSETTMSPTTVDVGTFAEISHSVLTFTPVAEQTYSFTVTSSLGNSVVYDMEAE